MEVITENTLSFEQFIEKLVYDIEISEPINEEAWSIDFPYYTTVSSDNFVRYIISLSYWYEEYLVVAKSDLKTQKFRFKCSYDGCGMKLTYKKKGSLLFIDKDPNNTIFNHSSHDHKSHKHRMTEETYKEFILWSNIHGNIMEFTQRYDELK